jgi:hypothetical protein
MLRPARSSSPIAKNPLPGAITKMRIVAHTKYGVFKGVERDYNEQEYADIGKLLEKLPKLEYFSFMTDAGGVYMTKEMIADSLFVLEK